MKRKFTIVSRVFSPEPVAVAIQLSEVFDFLTRSSHEVKVLTTKPHSQNYTKDPRIKRWPVIRDSQGIVRGYLPYISFDFPLFFRIVFSRNLGTLLVMPPPTTGFIVRLACWLRRKKYIYFADDLLSAAVAGSGARKTLVNFVKFLERFSLKGAKSIITISDSVKNEIIDLIGDKHRIVVVGTGIDTSVFSNKDSAAFPKDKYLLYSGTFSDIHGATVFVEGFAEVYKKHPGVRMLFYGQGTEDRLLKSIVNEKNLPVDFFDLVSSGDIAKIMRGAIAGLASVRPGKGYDFAYATKAFAMVACGLPVIYAGVGPVRKIISDNKLGLVADWDSSQVARLLDEILTDPFSKDERDRLAKFASENFSYRKVAEKIEQELLS